MNFFLFAFTTDNGTLTYPIIYLIMQAFQILPNVVILMLFFSPLNIVNVEIQQLDNDKMSIIILVSVKTNIYLFHHF